MALARIFVGWAMELIVYIELIGSNIIKITVEEKN